MRYSIPLLAALVAAGATGPALAQNHPLLGDWIAEGQRVEVERCGQAYCSTIATGDYAGTPIARVSGPGPSYEGVIADPRAGDRYDGAMEVRGDTLALRGCLMEVFCRTVQTWRRP